MSRAGAGAQAQPLAAAPSATAAQDGQSWNRDLIAAWVLDDAYVDEEYLIEVAAEAVERALIDARARFRTATRSYVIKGCFRCRVPSTLNAITAALMEVETLEFVKAYITALSSRAK